MQLHIIASALRLDVQEREVQEVSTAMYIRVEAQTVLPVVHIQVVARLQAVRAIHLQQVQSIAQSLDVQGREVQEVSTATSIRAEAQAADHIRAAALLQAVVHILAARVPQKRAAILVLQRKLTILMEFMTTSQPRTLQMISMKNSTTTRMTLMITTRHMTLQRIIGTIITDGMRLKQLLWGKREWNDHFWGR